jgi:hypothetical protein
MLGAMLCLAGCASAAWLPEYYGTFPTTDDDRQDCTLAEVPSPREGVLIRGLFKWTTGSTSWTDTLPGIYGGGYVKPTRWAPRGTYSVEIVYADSSWNKSCPVVVAGIKSKKNPPGRGSFGTR